MDFKIGDFVTRESYDNDLVFTITRIEENLCYLKGVNIRLCADSDKTDLNKCNSDIARERDEEFLKKIEPTKLDRDDYFYLPGKILHIDADCFL